MILFVSIIRRMNSKHRKTLQTIFSSPAPANLEWRKIEALFLALGAQMVEDSGSRVSFILNNEKADYHRPHPEKEAKRYQVRAVRDFLELCGEKP